jgi:hypothetical protein
VSISTTGIISVKDSLINEGTLINNGNMVVGGTWLNLGTYNAGEGQITFNSTDTSIPQVINHNSQSISKLVISGGGAKQILADLTVVGSLTLTDGIIIAQNGNQKFIFLQQLLFRVGQMHRISMHRFIRMERVTKLFPVGNGTTYLPVEISGITTNSEIGIALTELQTGETLNHKFFIRRYF